MNGLVHLFLGAPAITETGNQTGRNGLAGESTQQPVIFGYIGLQRDQLLGGLQTGFGGGTGAILISGFDGDFGDVRLRESEAVLGLYVAGLLVGRGGELTRQPL